MDSPNGEFQFHYTSNFVKTQRLEPTAEATLHTLDVFNIDKSLP